MSHSEVQCTHCEDFTKFASQMPWGLLYAHGWRYDGPYFKYCPFCGQRLEKVEVEDANTVDEP